MTFPVPCTRIGVIPKQWWGPYWEKNSTLLYNKSDTFLAATYEDFISLELYCCWITECFGCEKRCDQTLDSEGSAFQAVQVSVRVVWSQLSRLSCLSSCSHSDWPLSIRTSQIHSSLCSFQSGWKETQAMHFVLGSSTKVGSANSGTKAPLEQLSEQHKNCVWSPLCFQGGFCSLDVLMRTSANCDSGKEFKCDGLSLVLGGIFVHIIKPLDTIWKCNWH